MLKADGRHLLPAQQLGRHDPAVARDYVALGIHQDGHIKAKCLNAASDLTDLPRRMCPRVAGVKLKRRDRHNLDRQAAEEVIHAYWAIGCVAADELAAPL